MMIKNQPDRYCATTPDGDCVSDDPRCMHMARKLINPVLNPRYDEIYAEGMRWLNGEREMYLVICEHGSISTATELPEDVVKIVENGVADFVRVNDDGMYERLTFEEVEGMSDVRAVWTVI